MNKLRTVFATLKLYIAAKVARMDVQHVIRLLEIANNHLPSVEYTYENRKRQVDDLEVEKRNSIRIYQEINDKILSMRNRLDSINLDCEKELAERDQLYQKRMKLQDLVRRFENNNEEYVNLTKKVEEKVHSILSDRTMVLKLALLSLIESMRNNPDKYNALIFCDTSRIQTTGYSDYYDTGLYGQQQQYPSQDYISAIGGIRETV
jgi:chromosome segregation ATPase